MFFRFVVIILLLAASMSASAAQQTKQPIEASLVLDATNHKVLHAVNMRKIIYPASLTKMMTVYLAFEDMKNARIDPNADIVVSNYAASARPCKLGLQAGQIIKFKTAVLASIVKSANDATKALAEKMSGSEELFALRMNKKAKMLGMSHTHFTNSTGWPDKRQVSTAHDMATLALALQRDFPQYYSLFSHTSFVYDGKLYTGHNHVTKNYAGAEGMKTGFTNASGFNLVTAASRNNQKLIGVVIGGKTAKMRDNKMMALLDNYFAKDDNTLKVGNKQLAAKSFVGQTKGVKVKKARPLKS